MNNEILYKDKANKEEENRDGKRYRPGNTPEKKDLSFLVKYAMTLLAVSFIIVLLSYLNEIRVSRSAIADLKQEKERFSLSAMQDIRDLEQQNMELTEKIEDLLRENDEHLKRIGDLEKKNAELEALISEYREKYEEEAEKREGLEARQKAIGSMMRIDELYSDRKYNYSAYEISVLEKGDREYISNLFSGTENGEMIEKLISRYSEIRAWLEEKGYLDPEKIEKWRSKNTDVLSG